MNRTIYPLPTEKFHSLIKYDDLQECEDILLRKEFLNGLSFQEFNMVTKSEEEVKLTLNGKEGFLFLYCWEGSLMIDLDESTTDILPFHSAIFFHKDKHEIVLNLKSSSSNRFCIIGLRNSNLRDSDENISFYTKFKNEFLSEMKRFDYIYVGKPHVKLWELIDQLSDVYNQNSTSDLVIHGLILQVLGQKLEQLLEIYAKGKKDYCSLTNREIESIKSMSNAIQENPANPYTIDQLCRKTGLSPAKLQEGFKYLYDRTAFDFIRDIRLEKAKDLMKTTDLNVTEIVYSVGLTSRSYFAKIFKSKYNCAPKQYQHQLKKGAQLNK